MATDTVWNIKLRPRVRRFAGLMEQRLRIHDSDRGKRGWRDDNDGDLIMRIEDELGELKTAPTNCIPTEAADVANFAMMVADNNWPGDNDGD